VTPTLTQTITPTKTITPTATPTSTNPPCLCVEVFVSQKDIDDAIAEDEEFKRIEKLNDSSNP
jgi:hypothetical protein